VAPLDGAQGVEGLHDRYVEVSSADQRGQPAHPEVRMHHLRSVCGPPVREVVAERRHVGQQVVLGQLRRRTGGHVIDHDPVAQRDLVGDVRVVAAGVHDHLVTLAREGLRERRHVHVLATGVHAAHHCQWVGVLGNHGDPHPATSLRSRSQSSRNLASP
jgi:hypothetical protein